MNLLHYSFYLFLHSTLMFSHELSWIIKIWIVNSQYKFFLVSKNISEHTNYTKLLAVASFKRPPTGSYVFRIVIILPYSFGY